MNLIQLPREERFRMKWWGWGNVKKRMILSERPGALEYLKKYFSVEELKEDIFDQFSVVPTSLPQKISDELKSTFKNIASFDPLDCLLHSYGKSYKDLLKVRNRKLIAVVDVVFYPRNENDIAQILNWAMKNSMAIIPFGGGTSVVSGLEMLKGKHQFLGVVDLFYFEKDIVVDKNSMLANIPCHLFGPEIEEKLNCVGFTVGHFPQSFEFSTLGGWIAARSSGQNSIAYGGIEKLIQSIRIITPKGVIETMNVPRAANGPDIKEILMGSEGILGIITEAQVRISKLPAKKIYKMYAFKNFQEAVSAAQKIVQLKVLVSMVRVSDEEETEGHVYIGKSANPSLLQSVGKKFFIHLMKSRGLDPKNFSSVMIGYEGTENEVAQALNGVDKIFSSLPHVCLGESPGKKWLNDRFALPYLRDEFLNQNILVDTLESATTWSHLFTLYNSVRNALYEVGKKQNIPLKVYAHVSHVYTSGASLYFTILAKQHSSNQLEQWRELKETANKAIVKNYGVISHHHGLGVDHKEYAFNSILEKNIIKNIKNELDPEHIMNPEKVI